MVGGNGSGGPVTVSYSMTGSAVNGSDYSSLAGTVVIPNSATSSLVNLVVTDDSEIESVEFATLIIDSVSGTGAVVDTTASSATITISSDDVAWSAETSIAATAPAASEPGTDGLFTISLDSANTTGSPITVNYNITGTAANGTDYATIGTSVDIPNGASAATVTIDVTDDSDVEGIQTATLTLTSTSNPSATIGAPNNATVNIADDDAAFSANASIVATTSSAGEPGTDGLFTISLNNTNTTGNPIVVNYTVTGTATNGTDYDTIGTSVSIPDGQISQTVTVDVTDDSDVEGTQTVILTLNSATSPVTIGSPASATVNIADDDSGLLVWIMLIIAVVQLLLAILLLVPQLTVQIMLLLALVLVFQTAKQVKQLLLM